MSNAEQAEAPKRAPGRPRKAPRHVVREPVHQGTHGGDEFSFSSATYSPYEPTSVFEIDRDILDAIRTDHGIELVWVTTDVAGKPFPDFLSQRLKNHGQVVQGRNVFGGKIAHLCNKEGRYVRENSVLVAMPIEMVEACRAHERRKARAQVDNNQRSHSLEGVPVEGGSEEAARKQNFHKRSYEPFRPEKIPD
jgi:hypothetical protein